MRYFAIIAAAALAATGCGRSDGPVKLTPEMEAEQKEAERAVKEAESQMQKQQKKQHLTPEQRVQEEESRLQRGKRP